MLKEPDDVSKQAEVVAIYKPVFDLMDLGQSRPECNYPFHYQQGFCMEVPNFIAARRLSVLLAARIRQARHQADWGQANRVGIQGYRWVRTYEPKCNLISLMIRIALTRNLTQALRELAPAQITPELRQECQLLQEDLQKSWELAFTGERLATDKLYKSLAAGQDVATALGAGDGPRWNNVASAVYTVGGQPLVLVDELAFLKTNRAAINDPNSPPPAWGITYPFAITCTLIPNTPRAWHQLTDVCASLDPLIHP